MVPRSFLYTKSSDMNLSTQNEKAALDKRQQQRQVDKDRQSLRSKKPVRMCTTPPAVPSQPVVIPTRCQSPRLRSRHASAAVSRKSTIIGCGPHHPDTRLPSAAALLAETAIPPMRRKAARFPHTSAPRTRGSSLEILDGDRLGQRRTFLSSLRPGPWDVLQSPPDDEVAEGDVSSLGGNSVTAPLSSFRSLSSDSMSSMEADLGSPESSSYPNTPAKRPGQRNRVPTVLTLSPVQTCGLDHPLSLLGDEADSRAIDTVPDDDTKLLSSDIGRLSIPFRSAFKSNLTMSIRALKSAAQSLSHSTIQREEFLTRLILAITPQFTDEIRPARLKDIPDPATRRYHNPTHTPLSKLQFYHHHGPGRGAQDRCTVSIQLQPYQRATNSSQHATSPPIFTPSSRNTSEAEVAWDGDTSNRPREPRENSDFLRVIVLEMNMRKAGKLNDATAGRARTWLPPRQATDPNEAYLERVPTRWVGVVP